MGPGAHCAGLKVYWKGRATQGTQVAAPQDPNLLAMQSGGVQGDDKKSKQAMRLASGLAVSRDTSHVAGGQGLGESQILEGHWSCLSSTIEPALPACWATQPGRGHGT